MKIHKIEEDGLPDMENLVGRVAFIFDGCIVSGWPLDDEGEVHAGIWEADSDVGRPAAFVGVTHWVEFDQPVWFMISEDKEPEIDAGGETRYDEARLVKAIDEVNLCLKHLPKYGLAMSENGFLRAWKSI